MNVCTQGLPTRQTNAFSESGGQHAVARIFFLHAICRSESDARSKHCYLFKIDSPSIHVGVAMIRVQEWGTKDTSLSQTQCTQTMSPELMDPMHSDLKRGDGGRCLISSSCWMPQQLEDVFIRKQRHWQLRHRGPATKLWLHHSVGHGSLFGLPMCPQRRAC
jgi:hypothetical protein